MKYDLKSIGNRIRKQRKEAGYTQGKLAQQLYLSEDSRQTIGKWEKGEVLPDMEQLLLMCDLFNCELGYLLCEYDCKTRNTTDITEITGLSEKAVNSIIGLKNSEISDVIYTLSKVVCHKNFAELLCTIHTHIWDFNNNRFQSDIESINTIAKCMNCKNMNLLNSGNML